MYDNAQCYGVHRRAVRTGFHRTDSHVRRRDMVGVHNEFMRSVLGAGLIAYHTHARMGAARCKRSVFYHALLHYVFLVCVFGIYVPPKHAAQTRNASSACPAAFRADRAASYQSVHGLFIHVRRRYETDSRTSLLYAARAGGFVPLIIRSAVSRSRGDFRIATSNTI